MRFAVFRKAQRVKRIKRKSPGTAKEDTQQNKEKVLSTPCQTTVNTHTLSPGLHRKSHNTHQNGNPARMLKVHLASTTQIQQGQRQSPIS